MWVVIPLKDPSLAKSRLAVVLSQAERRRLFFLTARRVITAAQGVSAVEGVLVVTPSAEVADFALALGARVIADDAQEGTAAACRLALAQLNAEGVQCALILPGDLPLADAAAVSAVAARLGGAPGVVILPDARGEGTNALMLSPLTAIAPAFGPDSARAHIEAARRAGLAFAVMQIPALQQDLDDLRDFEAFRRLARSDDPAALALDPELRAFFRETDRQPSDG